ncbi:MAG TPA: (2Fe-2S)-binding protein, partial [Clostridia bacterium]|nr:(2Fe-2S)-binding protein [Clostridia bacterium]
EKSRYNKMVCRCEKVSEGKIIEAIHTNPKAITVDAIKRRTRSGMGRCQGGFCMPSVVSILARELGIDVCEVRKSGGDSRIVVGKKE